MTTFHNEECFQEHLIWEYSTTEYMRRSAINLAWKLRDYNLNPTRIIKSGEGGPAFCYFTDNQKKREYLDIEFDEHGGIIMSTLYGEDINIYEFEPQFLQPNGTTHNNVIERIKTFSFMLDLIKRGFKPMVLHEERIGYKTPFGTISCYGQETSNWWISNTYGEPLCIEPKNIHEVEMLIEFANSIRNSQ